MKMTASVFHAPYPPSPRFLVLILLCASLLLPGCLAGKGRDALRQENAHKDMQRIREPEAYAQKKTAKAEAPAPKVPIKPSGLLGLDDAVAFALERNLEALVVAQEKAVQEEMVTGAKYRLMPNLLIEAERSRKSWDVPSYSVSAYTGQVSLEPSISTELYSRTQSVGLSWDLLNLGVNIVRWKQVEGKSEIAAERLRRAKQDIALSVTRTYLKAAVSKDAAKRAQSLLDEGRKRREIIDRQIKEGVLSKVDGLTSDVSITEMMLRLKTYSSDYRQAMTELSELLGLKPEDMADIKDLELSNPPKFRRFDIAALETEALSKRPELFQQDIEQRISQQDASIAFIQMFPSLTPYFRYSYDANKYLSINDWYVVGLRLSWDLFSIPRLIYDRFTAQRQAELAERRRMKIALSVITQVRLAIIEYQETTDRLKLAADLEKERFELLEAVREQVRTGKLRESMLLEEDQRYLNARLHHLSNYAGALIALARLDNSIGRDWETERSDALRAGGAAPAPVAVKAPAKTPGNEAPDLSVPIAQEAQAAPQAEQPGTKAEPQAKAGQPEVGEVTITSYGGLRRLSVTEQDGRVAVDVKTAATPGKVSWRQLDNPPGIEFTVAGKWSARRSYVKTSSGELIKAVRVDQSADSFRLALEYNQDRLRGASPMVETADGGLAISLAKAQP